jgi:hypothetical protein
VDAEFRFRCIRATGYPAAALTLAIWKAPIMSLTSLRTLLAALAVLVLGASSQARADEGRVHISFIKAGWVIGGSVGSGTMTFRGRTYRLSVGGLSYGLTFGGSQTDLVGRVRNIYQPSDIEGVYGAGSAGAAVVRGAQAVVLTNQKGAVLELAGRQTGLIVNVDLSGLALTLK